MKRKYLVILKTALCMIVLNWAVLFFVPNFEIWMLIWINLLFLVVIYRFFSDHERFRESEEFVKANLSNEEFTEVIPINARCHQNFVLYLPKIAKFYAIRDKRRIIIQIQFHTETDLVFFESTVPEVFTLFYKIVEQDT